MPGFDLDLGRDGGLTHVLDKGLGPRAWEDVLETAGDYIDIVATVNTSVVNSTNPKIVTATVFRHVHVLRVGPPEDRVTETLGGEQ